MSDHLLLLHFLGWIRVFSREQFMQQMADLLSQWNLYLVVATLLLTSDQASSRDPTRARSNSDQSKR